MIVDPAEIRVALGIDSTISDDERALLTLTHVLAEGAVRRFIKYDPEQAARTQYYPRVEPRAQGSGGVWGSNGTTASFESSGGHDVLQLENLPLRSNTVIRIWEDTDARHNTQSGAFGTGTELTIGSDFAPEYDLEDSDGNDVATTGMVRRIGSWPTARGSIKVTYTAGYTAAELSGYDSNLDASALKLATLEAAVLAFKRFQAQRKTVRGFLPGNLKSERLGDYNYTLGGSADTVAGAAAYGFAVNLTGSQKGLLQEFRNYGQLVL
jgi:hypothetical protein